MKLIKYSDEKKVKEVVDRSAPDLEAATAVSKLIMGDVRERGDAAVIGYTKKFDRFQLTEKNICVSRKEIAAAMKRVDTELLSALKHAHRNISRFHREQMKRVEKKWSTCIEAGVSVGEKTTPIDSVGCYVPGGRASYASTVLMNCIPAKAAGVRRVVVASPPPISDAILAAAGICGVDEVYRVGGAQAVAALTYGTESIRKVDKIVGPGNVYVMAAKMLAFGKVGIDMPAGPSEVLILADDASDPKLIASDVLAQAEHDPAARCVVVTNSEKVIRKTRKEISRQLSSLKTRKTAEQSLEHATFILTKSLKESVDFANQYASEHLEVLTADPEKAAEKIRNAGAVFVGAFSPVAAGDYCSGGNHVLPTAGAARFASQLSVRDFLKTTSIQRITEKGLGSLCETIAKLAETEGFPAHKNSVGKRFK
jgi:histidinol dehydrogenase